MKYGKSELIRRLSDIPRKGWSENQVRDLIDSLWRNPELPTSGFRYAGGTDSEMGFDNGTRTFYIEPKTVLFGFYQKVTYLAYYKIYERQELQIENTEGLHLIYFDSDTLTKKQVLMELVNPTDDLVREIYLYKVIVSWIYWPKPGTGAIYFGEERHGCEWNPQIHWWAHRVFNGVRETGLRLTSLTYGDGSSDADAQFGVSAGSFHHEDMVHTVDAVVSTGGLPILYRYNNAGSLVPRFLNNYQFPVAPTLTDRIYYNDSSGELVPALDDRYVLCHVFAPNCKLNQVIAVVGQAQYQTIREAFTACQNEIDQILTWMPQQTRLHISSVVYHTKNTYTNAPNARIVAEVTPEDLAEIVAEDVTPYVKTGWTPNIQKEAYFTEDAGNTKIILEADPGPAQHFVEGDRRTPEPLTNLTLLTQTGMQYIRKYLDNFDISVTPFAGNEKNFVMVSALYWNNRQGYFCYTGWRMHPWEMEPATRGNIIKKTGLELVTGLELSINTDVGLEHTVNITEGSIRLADITAEIMDGGAALFKQQLTPLEARRYYLKTYSELSDPEDPLSELIITHEWEYQHLIANNVAKLSAGNQVEINKLDTGAWILEETADNDYSAMWLIATLDHQYPLKWIVGSEKSTDLDEAKELNTPETLLAILNAAQMMDHYIVLVRVIVKNIAADPYYELAEIDPYGDGEFDAETKDRHVIAMDFDEGTNELVLKRNAGLPELRQVIPAGSGGGVTDVYVEPHPQFPIDLLHYTKEGSPYYVTDIPKANGIVFGGLVSWLGNLDFAISPAAYYINGVLYTTGSETATLAAADPTNPRIDLLVVDTSGNVSVITGTPASSPQKPTPDPVTQIELTSILILAGATEPGNPGDVTDELIYDENVEWTPSSSGVTVDFNSTTDPFRNTKCADVGAIGTNDAITFTAGSAKNVANYENLLLYLKMKATTTKQHILTAQFLLSGSAVTGEVIIPFNGTQLTWQNISLAMSSFTFTGATFDALRLKWVKNGAQVDHSGFYLDFVRLEKGITQPPVNSVDTYVTGMTFTAGTPGTLTLFRNNNLAPLTVEIPAGEGTPGPAGEDGADGREVELSVSGGYIVWRYVGDVSWTNLVELATLVGPTGAAGSDGTSMYTYVAYASDNAGTGFSLTPTDLLKYRAEIHVTSPLTPPTSTDFTGATWVKYLGDDGEDGGGGDTFLVHLKFEAVGSIVYTAPYACKFTAMKYSQTNAPTLSVALDTNIAEYGDLTVAADATGLVTLTGIWL